MSAMGRLLGLTPEEEAAAADLLKAAEEANMAFEETQQMLEDHGVIPPSGAGSGQGQPSASVWRWVTPQDTFFQYVRGLNAFRQNSNLSENVLKAMSDMDPISGVGQPGSFLSDLTPTQQRDYFANLFAIALLKNWKTPSLALPKLDEYVRMQTQFGWATITAPDEVNRAYVRLQGTGGTFPTDMLQQEGRGQECLKLSQKECVSCIEAFKDPGLAGLLDVCYRPYEITRIPGKAFQYVVGADGKGYLVLEMGDKVHGAKLSTALLVGGAIALGGIGATGYYLLRTKKGKKLAKKLGII